MKVESISFGTVTCSQEGCSAQLITTYNVSIPPSHGKDWITIRDAGYGPSYTFCPEHSLPLRTVLESM